jgi:hypothetical protein
MGTTKAAISPKIARDISNSLKVKALLKREEKRER